MRDIELKLKKQLERNIIIYLKPGTDGGWGRRERADEGGVVGAWTLKIHFGDGDPFYVGEVLLLMMVMTFLLMVMVVILSYEIYAAL